MVHAFSPGKAGLDLNVEAQTRPSLRGVPPGAAMNQGKLVFAQVMAHLPLSTFRRCVARYDGEHKVKSFSCLDQFYAMAFAQLTFRESLRDIEASNGPAACTSSDSPYNE